MPQYNSTDKRTQTIGILGYTDTLPVLEVIGDTTFQGEVRITDDDKLRFGTSSGGILQIYTNGTNSFFKQTSGDLKYELSNQFVVQKDTGDEPIAVFSADGSVELYYDNSKKFETTASGIDVTGLTDTDTLNVSSTTTFQGNVTFSDSVRAHFGNDEDLSIVHIANQNWIQNNTGNLNIQQFADDSDITFRSDDGSGGITEYINIDGSTGEVVLYHYGSQKLATKSTGVTVTGTLTADGVDLGDDEYLRVGDGLDFQISHSSSTNSTSLTNSTGDLFITNSADDQDIFILSDDAAGGTTTYIRAQGSTGSAILYHYGSQKLATKATGVDVTGTLTVDGVDLGDDDRLRFGDGQDLQIYHNSGNNNSVIQENGTGDLNILANDLNIRNQAGNETIAQFNQDAGVSLNYDNSKKFETTSTGILVDSDTALGGTAGDSQDIAIFETANGNASKVKIVETRYSSGSDWTTAYTRIQKQIDSTNQGYIQFNGSGLNYGIEIGNATDGEKYATFARNAAATLYHDGVGRFNTTSTGATVIGTLLATSLSTGAAGTGINISTNTITGPSTLTIDPAAIGDNTGTVVIAGNLQIDGTTTTVNSTTMTVDDKNLELGTGAANDAAADGGGITIVSGDGNKTFQFEATGDNLGSSENLNLADTKEYKINNTSVLSATTLGTGVVNSSLTSVGTLTSLSVSGDLSIADKIVHIGDTDTAIRFPLNDTFTVETAGSERLRITSDGVLLVGTNSTSNNLASAIFEGNPTTNPGNFAVTSSSSNPANGDHLGTLAFADSGHLQSAFIGAARDGGTWTSGSSQPTLLKFNTTPDGSNQNGGFTRMVIKGDGKIGINETNPLTGLTINEWGTQPVPNSNTYPYPAGNWVTNWVTQTNNSNDYWAGFGGGGYLRSSATVNIALAPNHADTSDQAGMYIAGEATSTTTSVFTIGKIVGGSATGSSSSPGTQRATKDELFRITDIGNVGINTTAPREKLDISAGRIILDEDYQFTWANGTTNRVRIYGDSGDNFIVENGSSNTERFRIGSAGQIGLGGANYGTSGQVLTSNGATSAPTWQDVSSINLVNESTDTETFLTFALAATGQQALKTNANLTFNSSTGALSASTYVGNLTNTLTLGVSGNGLSGSATYNNSAATTFTVTSNATSANTASTIVFRDASGNFTAGTITGSVLVSNIATGTAPLTVTSTTLVTNLNADLLDGQEGSFYTNASNINAGTLAIAYGGTNSSATPTAGGAAYGTGTAYAFTAAGTSGQVLTSNGAAAPTWQDVAVAATDESTDTTCFPLFATAATGAVTLKTDASGLTYDSANERLQSTDVTVKGAVRCENSASTERFEILYNETTDSLDFSYFAS